MSRECLFLLLMFNVSTHRIHYPWCNGHISCRLVDREPYLSMTLALHGLNLVELDLGIKADSFHTTTKEAYAFYASLPPCTPSASTSGISPRRPLLDPMPQKLFTHSSLRAPLSILSSWRPRIRMDRDQRTPAVSLLELSTTGENHWISGPPSLMTITLESTRHCLTPGLASSLNFRALRTLYLKSSHASLPTTITERFWAALAKMGPAGVQLECLRCPRLSPRLVEFLSSFTGLRSLDFDLGFCPVSPSKTLSTSAFMRHKEAAYEPHDLTEDELTLVDAFFNHVLQKHRITLEHLVFGRSYGDDERWSMTPEYLQQISRCTMLRHLQFHVRSPVDDLVRFLSASISWLH